MRNTNYMRRVRVTIGRVVIEDLEIWATSPFDNDVTPNETRIQILNMSDKTVAKIKRGMKVTLEAGYAGDFGVLSVGKLDRITERWEGPTKINSFYYFEGDDFSKIKVDEYNATRDTVKYHNTGHKKGDVVEGALAINFAKGTDGMTIIKRLTEALGMTVEGTIELRENRIYKKGFSCTKIILNDLEQVVNDCGSIIYHRRGKIVIRPIDKGVDERFKLNVETGLIGSPSYEEKDGAKVVKVRCALQHRITTCSIIELDSKYIKGKFRAYKGEHKIEKTNFYTEFFCV